MDVGSGRKKGGHLELPKECCADAEGEPHTAMSLIRKVYGESPSDETLLKRAVLTIRNKDVASINEAALDELIPDNTTERTYASTDKLEDEEKESVYTLEVVNSIEPKGFLQHKLRLRVGMPVMMICNFAVDKGLCNGTRMIVRELLPDTVKVAYPDPFAGPSAPWLEAVLPRITQKCDKEDARGIEFSRTQFPIKPAFAITINKSQGQTLDKVGVDLATRPCFQHGQLYVALTRVRKREDLFIAAGLDSKGCTANVVDGSILEAIAESDDEENNSQPEDYGNVSSSEWSYDGPCDDDIVNEIPGDTCDDEEAADEVPGVTCDDDGIPGDTCDDDGCGSETTSGELSVEADARQDELANPCSEEIPEPECDYYSGSSDHGGCPSDI
eukprot:TRINITY_DN14374_c0_g2_i1.p1 TRINITY_DN14374_c0_g2~~TRINITY_DN14374_c0_g2_i1.p1  ORF type:complete len:386 (+),score=118.51 TRINITY_DN14374_c0_g2_i1:1-1158(+)